MLGGRFFYPKDYPMTVMTTMPEKSLHDVRWRIASEIHQQLQVIQLQQARNILNQIGTLTDPLERIQSGQRKLTLCLSHGWSAAGKRILDGIETVLKNLPHHVSQLQLMIEPKRCKLPSVREITEELVQLEDGFDEVNCDWKARTVTVTTEPIELEETYLGPFEVCLHIERIASQPSGACFDVIALDPHPAASNEGITHPHVSDERMCCGDASLPMKAAIEEGRLSDFFCLVRSVLETYNPDSPYISLNDWQGQPCYDCGFVMAEEETYGCSSCENPFCSECSSCCNRCDEIICGGCLTECPACGDRYCDSCTTTCPDCRETLCQTCLEDAQCPCTEEEQQLRPGIR